VTHDAEIAGRARRIVRMQDGRVSVDAAEDVDRGHQPAAAAGGS